MISCKQILEEVKLKRYQTGGGYYSQPYNYQYNYIPSMLIPEVAGFANDIKNYAVDGFTDIEKKNIKNKGIQGAAIGAFGVLNGIANQNYYKNSLQRQNQLNVPNYTQISLDRGRYNSGMEDMYQANQVGGVSYNGLTKNNYDSTYLSSPMGSALYNDSGRPKIFQNPNIARSYYNPRSNTIYATYEEDILSEIPHAVQRNYLDNLSKTKYTPNVPSGGLEWLTGVSNKDNRVFDRNLRDNEDLEQQYRNRYPSLKFIPSDVLWNKKLDEIMYNFKGSAEHEAHSIIEPKIREQLGESLEKIKEFEAGGVHEDGTNGQTKKSWRKGKKLAVWMDGSWHHFGDSSMQDFRTHKSEKRKDAYYSRHAKNLKGDSPRAKAFRVYSKKTWESGGVVNEEDFEDFEDNDFNNMYGTGGYLKDKDTYITKDGRETKRGLWANVYLKNKNESGGIDPISMLGYSDKKINYKNLNSILENI